ncbi:MAG: RAMP superfamily protein [Trichocoleus desertorum ATA4-8-CV12]|jgi:CRISPR-associated protein Cmr6|nr:RAMP superfamily protein [Trichocoleus desertorum ATA4-8-CV12]
MSNADDVPMMFRASVSGRCQLQYIDGNRNRDTESDIERWVSEWTIAELPSQPPTLSQHQSDDTCFSFQTIPYCITWRFVSNSGADPTIILPVIGARGFPYYPGSSMKGAFRQACNKIFPDRVVYYCGDRDSISPGILRFHGGYPTSNTWKNNLIDLAHPQQGWQVKNLDTRQKDGGAFVQISLHQPELKFGISSAIDLIGAEWQDIWQVWRVALSNGIGCRVSAGYGKSTERAESPLYKVTLNGQGVASTLLDSTPEFRPNIFRAALRGHALRIFGGLSDEDTAESLVKQLFGGIHNGTDWGLLSIGFRETKPFRWEKYGRYEMPYYEVKGELSWLLTQSVEDEKEKALKSLVNHLMQFSMLLGGFGRSWRRVDHRKFYPDEQYEKLIGCHWTWQKSLFLSNDPDDQLQAVGQVIDRVLNVAQSWMQRCQLELVHDHPAKWREAWCRDRAQVWGRVADDEGDSLAIKWFHQGYDEVLRGRKFVPTKQLKGTAVAGFTGNQDNPTRIGRLWHRMYPVTERIVRADGRQGFRQADQYLELLTFFPDTKGEDSKQLTEYLNRPKSPFTRLW